MSAQTVTAKIGGSANFLEVDETLTVGTATPVVPSYFAPNWQFANGTSAVATAVNQWYVPVSSPITLATAASVTYTLTALTDSLGRSISMAGGVRFLGILVTARTAGDYLTVGAAAVNPWLSFLGGTTPTIKVFDLFILGVQNTDKYAVAAGSNEQLKILNSGANNITFQFITLGCLT